jgi:hypothetical protein
MSCQSPRTTITYDFVWIWWGFKLQDNVGKGQGT